MFKNSRDFVDFTVYQCKTSIRGCNTLLLCITVKLVHKIMRVFYSHCFAFRYACDTQCVASGGMFLPHVECVPEKARCNEK